MVPGNSFCPLFSLDLDGNGVDELWYVNNISEHHPFQTSNYRLERVDARTGQTMGQWQWPEYDPDQQQGNRFRNFIFGGYVKGKPVLVTAQGTYRNMFLQAWHVDMTEKWNLTISKDAPGARGSHMLSITDLDGDGIEEVMWGERCIELDRGTERSARKGTRGTATRT